MARWLLALALMLALARRARAGPTGPPSCAPAERRCVDGGYDEQLNEYTYTVDGMHLLIEYTDGGYFVLKCSENLTLDNSAMPHFKSQLRVRKALLKDCPAPRGSYGTVLQRFNVTVNDKLRLSGVGNLTGVHLAGLGDVHVLDLVNAELAPRTLAAPVGLRALFLDNVRLPPGELSQLPRSLETLELTRMGTDVPSDVVERLPALKNIIVRDSSNVSVAIGGALRVLALEMPAARVPSALSPALQSLTVHGWDARQPVPWTACALDTLNLQDVSAEELPAQWLRNCVELRVLHVEYGPKLRALHAESLRGARNLQELHLASCALEALPAGLLEDAVKLRELDLSRNLLKELPSGLFVSTHSLQTLDLSRNFLKELPSGLFVSTHSLQTLDLSRNRLTTDVYKSLKVVTSLTTLRLSHNVLGDSCGGPSDTVRGVSPLESLKKLINLYLKRTNTSLICRDWRENMPLLKTLDLSENNFTSLTFADLQFRGGEIVTVNLSKNAVRELQYTQDDYLQATGTTETSRADVTLDNSLACDCYTYWAARALRERKEHLKLKAGCAHSQETLDSVALDSFVCGAPALCTATPSCTCAWRDSGVEAPARLLRVDCERAGLARLADVLAPLASAARSERVALDDYDWQLYLAHNHISDLSTVDFPKHLSVLDLRNNSLSLLSEDTVRALLADERRRVSLALNPLACNCSAADALVVMRAHQAALDYDTLTCHDGSLLSAARPPPCAAPRGLSAGVVAVATVLVTLLAAATLAGLLWHPALRLRIKAALHQRGWLPALAEPDDDERRFDVFLSFSHGDERFVRDELVARLESGPAPYRLCVHYRDWVPGGWIPAQIAASVRASRRTVAVVSAHFLRSAWARAEFQEAYALALRDARPRLVVVLLDDPAALPLDDKLRSYLATNTYVRWGDPWFWQKLRLALPRGRGRVPAAPPESVSPEPAAPAVALEVPGGPRAPTPELCTQPSAASSLNSATSSSCSSSSGSSAARSSAAGSVLELDRLMAPASCGACLGRDVSAYAGTHAVPV